MRKEKTDMKAKLRRQELCIGTHVSLGEGVVSEMMGNLDYDFLWIDMEHSCINTDQLLNHLMGARASGINAIVRIPWNDPVLAKPVLDAGADGIICPMVCSYEEAHRAVEATSYPPGGVRGYGPRRAAMFGMISGEDYRAHADENILRFIQLEHIDALRDLDRILTIPEIDAFLWENWDTHRMRISDRSSMRRLPGSVPPAVSRAYPWGRRMRIPCGTGTGAACG